MTQLFDIGRSALSSYQQALTTVSRNVANANTPGYARQSVQFGELAGGSGVSVVRLNRSADGTALLAARDAVDERAYAEVRADTLSRIDTVVSDDATGLAEPLRRLLASVDAMAAQPTDIATRQTLLAEADGFAAQVRSLDSMFTAEANNATTQLSGLVRQAQDQLDELATVQAQIETSPVMDAATATLTDRRDVLLEGLAESFGIRGQVNGDGTLLVTLGNGQPVIEAGVAADLGLAKDDDGNLQLTTNGTLQPSRVIGGEAGGLMQLLHTDIPAARDELGRIALSVARTFNDAQAAGVGLDGVAGPDLFVEPQPRITAGAQNAGSGSLNVTVTDLGDLPSERVILNYDGSMWTASTASGVSVGVSGSGTAGDPLVFGGMSTVISGTPAAGDQFTVEAAAPGQLQTQSLSPENLAAAAAGSGINSGDNSNTLSLQSTLAAGLLDGGRTSIQGANVNWVSQTGQTAAAAISSADVARATESFALDRRDSIQGVNLDEEAADLMRYQQAYAAAAQVLATASSLFETVLSALRR